MSYFLVFDAGTGSIRAVLFNEEGEQIGVAQKEWEHKSDPKYPGSMNFAWKENWQIIIQLIQQVVDKTKVDSADIRSISATSMREGFVLYDQEGNEIWACANVDARAEQEAIELKSNHANLEKEIYGKSGQTFALGAIPRILWIKNNEPELFEQIHTITMINDWILYKLSGVLQADPSNGCTTGMFDLQTRDWSVSILESCGINASIRSVVHEAGTRIGYVTKETSVITGLSTTTAVISGGGDAQMASVGAGLIGNHQALVSGGSFWQQELNIDKPVLDPEARIRLNCHAVNHLWQIETIAFFPGIITRWFRDSFCESEKLEAAEKGIDFYELMEQRAATVPAGSYGVMPIFSDVMNFISWRHAAPSFINLNLDKEKSGKHVLFKSIQENAAFVTFGNFKIIEELTGYYPKEVVFVGGASNGNGWCQILADVLGIKVIVPVVKESAALGTALYAGVGAGVYSSIEDAVAKTVKFESSYSPDLKNHQLYRRLYENWREIYKEQLKLADRKLTTYMWKAPGL
ncbi:autoinducer-2 kinase [Ureibacillus sp. NPDC094379]